MSDGFHHNLLEEFPEFREKIQQLKASDAGFRTLLERYEALDDVIARAEAREDLMSDLEEEKLRKERVQLKDQIYTALRHES